MLDHFIGIAMTWMLDVAQIPMSTNKSRWLHDYGDRHVIVKNTMQWQYNIGYSKDWFVKCSTFQPPIKPLKAFQREAVLAELA